MRSPGKTVPILAALLLAALLAIACTAGVAVAGSPATVTAGVAQPSVQASGDVVRAGDGYRFEDNGWIFLHIEGKPYQRGYQHGRLMAPELADTMRTLRHIMLNDTGQKWRYFVNAASRLWAKKLRGEYLSEIKGIAAGATSAGTTISWRQVLALNGEMELTGYWYPGILSGAYKDGLDKTHCSAFIATGSYTAGGKVVMAHNDWTTSSPASSPTSSSTSSRPAATG